MHEQTYLEFGEAISHIANRGMAKIHPQLGVKVSPSGEVFIPGDKWHKAHWTFGNKNHYGYRTVKIAGKRYSVHKLVAEAFLQYPIPEGMEVDHISRDRSVNRLSNLRVVSRSENRRNRADHDRVEEQGRTQR